MYLPEQSLDELPAFVMIASTGHSILAFGHSDEFATALMWCGRAMQRYGREAEQIAIFKPGLADWPGIGKISIVLPLQGWTPAAGGWKQAPERELQHLFDRVPEGPSTLLTDWPQTVAML
jgi:hypothetical protein